jgi:hypothetical protein
MKTEATMDLVPSERAVLTIVRTLFLESSRRTHTVSVLRSRWPALHSQAYDGGYAGLVSKGLLATSENGSVFSVTTAGLRAMANR